MNLEDGSNWLESLTFGHILPDATNPSPRKDFDEIYPQLGPNALIWAGLQKVLNAQFPLLFATALCLPS